MEIKSNITNGPTEEIFEAQIMGKYKIKYYRCIETGYIQVEKPYWLEEAYNSPMNLTDTGILFRNQIFLEKIAPLFYFVFPSDSTYLDYAGGYGIFTRMMRDLGFDYTWDDPFTKNLVARGFEYNKSKQKIQALTAFETFEHLVQPYSEIDKMVNITKNIVFSTQLVSQEYPQPHEWWYYGLEHGQHVSLYSMKSLEFIAKKFNFNLYTNGSDLHAFFDNNIFPRVLVGAWIKEFHKVTNHRFKLKYKTILSNTGKFQDRILDRIRYRDIILWQGTKDDEADLISSLKDCDFMKRYINHLLSEGQIYCKIVKRNLKSKTFNDMLWIRDVYLKNLQS